MPGDTTSLVPGFPIRTSSDHSSVGSSPRLIAASHVLHRLPVPRHPPCALTHLHTQLGRTRIAPHHNTHPHKRGHAPLDARNHYPQIKHHTPPPKTGRQQPNPTTKGGATTGLLPQSPIVCRWFPPTPKPRFGSATFAAHHTTTHYRQWRLSQPPHSRGHGDGGNQYMALLRKEVIQPHLPVRLPCYDFVPIADPTFDGSLPDGLGHRLRVLPTFMT